MKTLTRYQRPFNLLQDLQEEMSSLFGRGLGQDIGSIRSPLALFDETTDLGVGTSQWFPQIDVKEEINGYTILADVPGIDPKDVHVSVENNVLTITGERSLDKTEEQGKGKGKYTRTERSFGTFYRSFSLPTSADGTKVNAKYKNGVLTITLAKKESGTSKKIEVQIEK
jgi:HSP20 family protein